MSFKSEIDKEDVATIHQILGGDRDAFSRLMDRYEPAVAAMGRRFRQSKEETMDYVQDVFAKAFTHLSQFTGKGRFYSWLMSIASTTAINRAQRGVPEESTDPEVLERISGATEEHEPHRVLEKATLRESIAEAISTLPQNLAHSVELFFLCGLRYREIEEITGTPINTLKSNIHRARQLLRLRLRRLFPEGQAEG